MSAQATTCKTSATAGNIFSAFAKGSFEGRRSGAEITPEPQQMSRGSRNLQSLKATTAHVKFQPPTTTCEAAPKLGTVGTRRQEQAAGSFPEPLRAPLDGAPLDAPWWGAPSQDAPSKGAQAQRAPLVL